MAAATIIMTERKDMIETFLADSGWSTASRQALPQDASPRCYTRLRRGDETAILMDAPIIADDPPCPVAASEAKRLALGWSASARLASGRVEAFAAIADHLRAMGLSSPRIIAAEPKTGLALIEDFGEMVMAQLIEAGADEIMLYTEAARLAAYLYLSPVPTTLKYRDYVWPLLEFDRLALRVNMDLFIDHVPWFSGLSPASDLVRGRWENERDALIEQLMTFPRALILRDYHAENMLWLPERDGLARIGLLDFQDAVLGWGEWDLAMLLQDARRRVSALAIEAALGVWCAETGVARSELVARMAIVGAVNALRVAGIFARLIRSGKERYRVFQPRQLELLADCLSRPGLAGMSGIVGEIVPDGSIVRRSP